MMNNASIYSLTILFFVFPFVTSVQSVPNIKKAIKTLVKPPVYTTPMVEEAVLPAPETCQNNDVYCDSPGLITKYGYPFEEHKLTNQEGYILTTHRIPGGRKCNSKNGATNAKKPVVYLAHGAWCSSRDWLMNTISKALAYMLADAGYDVWLGNSRGNSYSLQHTNPNISGQQYWNFTFHELGSVDLPLWIDYILNATNQTDMYYIGHSMGTTQYFVLMSEHPEYNKKIRTMFALAPVTYYNNTKSFLKPLSAFYDEYEAYTLYLGNGEFFPKVIQDRLNLLGQGCDVSLVEGTGACDNLLYALFGYDPPQTNSTQVPIILSHTPSSISGKVMGHYLQLVRNGRFCQYDYGDVSRNQIQYGRDTPPDYKFSNIISPVIFFHSDNDLLADPTDVQRSALEFPNLKENNRVTWSKFTHIDFTYAIDANLYVYNHLISIMNNNTYYPW